MVRSLLLVFGALALGGGCGDARKAAPRITPDARVARRVDARAAARPRVPELQLGQGCRCPGVGAKPGDGEARHRALVGRIDRLNPGLRQLMVRLDRVLSGGQAARGDRSGLRAAHGRLACRLDCLLSQFQAFTAEFWRYLEAVALFLDGVVPALAQRAPDPAVLARRFNEVVRRSNFTSGLTLLVMRPPPRRIELDARSFGRRSRGWRKEALLALGRLGKVTVRAVRERPLEIRVAAARLLQTWRVLQARAQSLVCARSQGCLAMTASWGGVVTAAAGIRAALDGLVVTVRSSPAGPPGARAARVVSGWDNAVKGFKTTVASL